MNDQSAGERRRHIRIAPKGTVVLNALGTAHRARISNLGEGGIYLLTTTTLPERYLARIADIEIRLDGQEQQWLRATGRVLRIDPEGVAIVFDAIPAMLRRLIDEMATASRARSRVISVVLVDANVPRRTSIADGFRTAGCIVLEATTPLEAIVRLGESHFEPDAIAIADSTSAEELRDFVAHAHPLAQLVTIGDESINPNRVVDWLSSDNPRSDLPNRVRTMLGRPRRPSRPS